MPMEMDWKFNQDGSLEHITFQGLNGSEFVGNLKSALDLLKIKNPTSTFADRVKTGEFDNMLDDEYCMIYRAIDSVSSLWYYPDVQEEDELAQCEMNVLMLLANAIEVISKQDVTISTLRAERERRAMRMK